MNKGARYNLATAVGLNRLEDVRNLAADANASELYVALVVASFFGNTNMISFLLNTGADVNGIGLQEDFGGFHSHASALHQAVSSGSLESVRLLVDAGANLSAVDKIYNGSPLGWAMHMRSEAASTEKSNKFASIENFLKGYGED